MKRNLLQKYRGSLIASGIVGLLIVLGVFLHAFFPSVLARATTPLFSLSSALQKSVATTFVGITRGDTLAEENANLAREILILKAQVVAGEERCTTLETFIEHKTRSGEESDILGNVVAWPPMIPYDTLLVALPYGEAEEGMLALSYDIVPMGAVTRSYPGYAEVTLFSSPQKKTQVWVGDERIQGVLEGQGGGFMVVMLPQQAPVEVGEYVYLPYKGGTILGVVGEKKVDVASGTATLSVRQPLHPFSSSWVLFVDSPREIIDTSSSTPPSL